MEGAAWIWGSKGRAAQSPPSVAHRAVTPLIHGQFMGSLLWDCPLACGDNPSHSSEPAQLPGHPKTRAPRLGQPRATPRGGDLIPNFIYPELCCCHGQKENKLAVLKALDLGGSLSKGDNSSSSLVGTEEFGVMEEESLPTFWQINQQPECENRAGP